MDDTFDKLIDLSDGIESIPVDFKCKSDTEVGESLDNFKYCRVSIPGPGSDREKFEEQFEGCSCVEWCDQSECTCLTRYGATYDEKGRLLSHFIPGPSMKPVLECNKSCRCCERCNNRVVQHGVKYHLEVFHSHPKGFGLKAEEVISKNTFVCEYAGEILSLHEAQCRATRQKSTDMNYILILNEHCEGGMWRTCVDPAKVGNVGRFINHSCEPNLFMIPIRVNNNIPKLSLFAVHDIATGEELTFDYSGLTPTETSPAEPISSRANIALKPCFCGTKSCKGYLPFDADLYTLN